MEMGVGQLTCFFFLRPWIQNFGWKTSVTPWLGMTAAFTLPSVSSLEGCCTNVELYRMDIQCAPSRTPLPVSYPSSVAKILFFLQLLELKQHGNVIVSHINIRSHQVNYPKQALNQQGLFWETWSCTGHRWVFWPRNFVILATLILAIILKVPLSWQIIFVIW